MKNTIIKIAVSIITIVLLSPTVFAMSDTELHNLLEWRDKEAVVWRTIAYESRNSVNDPRPSYIPPVPPVYTDTQKFWLFFAGFSTFESAVNKLIANGVK